MPTFREIDEPDDDLEDIESPFHKRPITIEERDEILRMLSKKHSIGSIRPGKTGPKSEVEIGEDTLSSELGSKKDQSEVKKREFNEEDIQEHLLCKTDGVSEQEPIGETSGYTIEMYTPIFNGVKFDTVEELKEMVRESAPEFFSRKDSKRLLKDVRIHLELYNELSAKKFIPRGEIAAIAKRTGKSPTVIKRWLREGAMPQFYYLIVRVSKDSRIERIQVLLASLNGITDMESMDKRYATLYFNQEYSNRKFDAKENEYCIKFFKFLEEYSSGGSLVDICRKLKVGRNTVQEWFAGSQLPDKLKYAALIPVESPREGWKWLPMKLDSLKNIPEQFIQVPLEIDSLRALADILKQLIPLKEENEHLLEGLGEFHSFMYLLGLLASDGSFVYDTPYSAALKLWASKKYSWSKDLGNAFCDAVRRLGFSVEQHSDDIRIRDGKQFVFQQWRSEASPFHMWMKQALFGLSASEKKKEEPISSDWILKMPSSLRVAFIQGLADGDGHASIRAFDTGIATKTNKRFIQDLLASLNIHSRDGTTKVLIDRYSEILKAEKLPLFRFATGRQKKLEDLTEIIRKLDKGHGRVPTEHLRIIEELNRQGYTPGQITEILWYKYGIARSMSSVDGIIRRKEKKGRM
ncbi:MAG: hypothetical protein ACTSUO_02550 [Candidatus Thorarchaeota archaeon]